VEAVGEVQGREFNGADEHQGGGVCEDGGLGGGECVEGGVAAHETQVLAVDVGAEVEAFDQFDVNARGVEAGAGDGDEVGDLVGGEGGEVEGGLGGALGEGRGIEGVADHAGGGGGAAVIGGFGRAVEGVDFIDAGAGF